MTRKAYSFVRTFAPEPARELCVDRHYLLCASAGALRLEAQGQAWLLPPARAALIQAGRPIQPHARRPTPGSADVCLLVDGTLDAVERELEAAGVVFELGPVPRTGATGPIRSLYLRDPDDNLVELSEPL